MRTLTDRTYRLTFVLPRAYARAAGRCWNAPCCYGCKVNVMAGALVSITGPSREAVFEQAAQLLRTIAVEARRINGRRLAPEAITTTLQTPIDPTGRDSWSIIVGAPVSFSPTSIPPYFPRWSQDAPKTLVG